MVCANSARPRRALLWIAAALFATGCATLPVPTGAPHAAGSAGPAPEEPRPCGGQGLPEGWPDYSAADEALLAPFLACASPADFIELPRTVDMPRLVEALDDWSAVRLAALGPLRAGEDILLRRRAAFLLEATEKYGPAYAEVFALFILHSAFDDEVRSLLSLLAADKQLLQTLGPMGAVHVELERRGLKLSDFPGRGERSRDVLRGLG